MRTTILIGRPSLIPATLGGAAGALLFGSVLQVAGATGVPGVGLTDALGGLWLGSVLLFVVAWLILPLILVSVWKRLPGDAESVPGALLKGALFGAGLWLLAGVVLGLLGARGGWFGAADGAAGAVALLVAGLGYGLVAAAIASMGRGMAPLHALGWEGHAAGRAA